MPVTLKGKKKMLTLTNTERLNNISEDDLAKECQRALRKSAKHIIFRQTSIGGPLFDAAKNNDVLY